MVIYKRKVRNSKQENRNMIEQEMLTYMRANSDAEEGFVYVNLTKDYKFMSRDEDILLQEVTVKIPTPSKYSLDDLRKMAIDSMREKQSEARAEAEKKCLELQGKIDKLLLLEYKPEVNQSSPEPEDDGLPF